MIDISGDYLEGGGQILRTSLALSCVTEKPFRIYNIRGKRKKPGLRTQHFHAFKACSKLCSANCEGVTIGSEEVIFKPKEIKSCSFNIDIGTAGGIGLILQSIILPASFAPSSCNFSISGGTCGKGQIPVEYYNTVLIPVLKRAGADINLHIINRGYYPKGGGKVEVEMQPIKNIKRLKLLERGNIVKIEGISYASSLLKNAKVAERQKDSCKKYLLNFYNSIAINIKYEYSDSLSVGSGIVIWVETEKGAILGADALGERGKPAEVVGEEAAKKLYQEISSNAPVDKHLADNLIPWLAIAGGSIRTSEITLHTRTNIWVSELFLGEVFRIKDNIIISKAKTIR